jgi:TolB-like protein/Tfp pilus assembly protein PilF
MVANALEWPHLVIRILTLLLLLGVPLVVTLAWFHGHRAHQRVGRLELGILGALLVVGVAVMWFLGRPTPDGTSTDHLAARAVVAPGDLSIAVLPFVNMSSDPEQEYFSDGMTEQILSLLAKTPDLRVIARTSSFAFKGQKDVDVATIAQRLNVSHVLEGSVQKAGNRVRITAQLIDSSDSSHEWSENYDRELTDVFAVQDEIATAVVKQLKLALLDGGLPVKSSTTSLDAYNWYLRGLYLSYQHTEESLKKAIGFYEKALDADPKYAEAWAALAHLQALTAGEGIGFTDYSVAFETVRASAQKAIDLNPALAKAHLVLGQVYQYEWKWLPAQESYARAIAHDPSDADALTTAGLLDIMLGKREVGIERCRQAVARDPVSPRVRFSLAYAYLITGKLDDAENETRAALELSPTFTWGRYLLGHILLLKGQAELALQTHLGTSTELWRLAGLPLAYHALGQKESSDAALKELVDKGAEVAPYQIGEIYAYRGEKDESFVWLERAYSLHDPGIQILGMDPFLDNIRSDPRYAAMLQGLKLPDQRRE